jgi:signal peptidase I
LETTLFWIGCGLGGYAYVLRQIFKKEVLLNRRALVGALHVFFMAAVGALIGFVMSASVDLHGPSPRWPVTLAVVGLLWGVYQSTRKFPKGEGPALLLAGDLDLVETSFSAVLLAAVIMYAVVQAFKIPSGSMEDTLHIGDHLFVNKFMYGIRIPWTEKRVLKWRDVQRGDVVVFQCPPSALSEEEREHHVRKDFIKRAVGLPGDEIRVKNKRLYINGLLQTEPYAIYRDPMVIPDTLSGGSAADIQKAWQDGELAQHSYVRDNFGPVKLPAGSYFVMGDNRDGSFDARFWGPLPNRLLKGKAWFVYWPLGRIKVIR